MSKIRQTRRWLDAKTRQTADPFDIETERIQSSTETNAAIKTARRQEARWYDILWTLEMIAGITGGLTVTACAILGAPIELVGLVLGCHMAALALLVIGSRTGAAVGQKLYYLMWAIHCAGTAAGIQYLLTR